MIRRPVRRSEWMPFAVRASAQAVGLGFQVIVRWYVIGIDKVVNGQLFALVDLAIREEGYHRYLGKEAR